MGKETGNRNGKRAYLDVETVGAVKTTGLQIATWQSSRERCAAVDRYNLKHGTRIEQHGTTNSSQTLYDNRASDKCRKFLARETQKNSDTFIGSS